MWHVSGTVDEASLFPAFSHPLITENFSPLGFIGPNTPASSKAEGTNFSSASSVGSCQSAIAAYPSKELRKEEVTGNAGKFYVTERNESELEEDLSVLLNEEGGESAARRRTRRGVRGGKNRKAVKKVPEGDDKVLAERFRTKKCRNFMEKGTCPYESRCMFAHGDHQLRTAEMNLRDGLVNEEAIRQFKRMLSFKSKPKTAVPEHEVYPPHQMFSVEVRPHTGTVAPTYLPNSTFGCVPLTPAFSSQIAPAPTSSYVPTVLAPPLPAPTRVLNPSPLPSAGKPLLATRIDF